MDTKQISFILTIAEEGGITKAANKLFISQSALDQQLLKLENELGTQLFVRSHNNFFLTKAGEVYVAYAKRMLSLKNEAYSKIQDLTDRQKGTLSLAFAPERGMEMFMSVYPEFYQAYPEVVVRPREIGVKKQLEMLQNEELDLGFVSLTAENLPGLVLKPLLKEEFVFIVPLSHPLSELAAPPGKPLTVLEVERLKDLTFSLMYKESTQRKVIDSLFVKHGIDLKVFLTTASNRANISMVKNGLSCSILPYYYVRNRRDVACFRLFDRPSWALCACYRANRYLSNPAKRFTELAKEYFEQENRPKIGE
ncbi:LysR family transcriptional regulator [Caproiciproducens sp. NJN-50]|uniref:LysR family transcriptional regulator n=1 Tax=Acutalibacteraceae TaxID=3082771 RepID=UPI000FFE16CE|nr:MULTISPECIES: LysR family transcriptional regulator [Acutalibacteraceae]QAT48915.1 LysR family transcriptional regulator [Caproiciproducens sp. NJN-50]